MRRARILIVDDREINRYIRGEVLRKAGYELMEATTGEEGLQKCHTEHPDLLLLDINLPDMTGYDVCRRVKENPRTAAIMVVQITASAMEISDAVMGLDSGADDYLIEPVEPALLVAKVRSILRLRAVEEFLRRSNDDLTQFAYAASHDLQEPLRTIASFAQLLDRNYRDNLDDRAREYIDYIISGSMRMRALITDLLEYSRVSSTTPEEPTAVDMNEVVNEVHQSVAVRLAEARGTLEATPLPVIEGPRVRLLQLVRNLVENSIKYRRADVPLSIRVSAEKDSRDWVFSIADNGQGFDQKFAEQIFGVFRRLHGGNVSGTGIGLAICRNVVERAGGRIWAKGRPGEGATFYFTWPAI